MQSLPVCSRLLNQEIGPNPSLNITKFLGVAESLPDCARDSFDQVYRAIDIYLQGDHS
ncbi:hypothetical protein ACS0TY_012922 [Phlomoides rotata]